MKKRISIVLTSAIVCVCMFTGIVSAVEPGASDYTVTQEVRVSDVAGDNIELTNVDAGTIVTIAKTALPAGVVAVKFEAKTIATTDPAFVKAETAAKAIGANQFVLFNFSLTDTYNNTAITKLNGKISVTVACPKGMNKVLYFNEATGKVEDMGAKVSADGKFITFETDHFSYYALAKVDAPKVTIPKPTTPPKTGDSTSILVVSIMILAAGLVFAGKKVLFKNN